MGARGGVGRDTAKLGGIKRKTVGRAKAAELAKQKSRHEDEEAATDRAATVAKVQVGCRTDAQREALAATTSLK